MFKNRFKILFAIFLFLSISFLGYQGSEKNDISNISHSVLPETNFRNIQTGNNPVYDIYAKYDWNKQLLHCRVTVNTDSVFIKNSALYFLLPANGLKSNRTFYASNFNLAKENLTWFQFDKISVNGFPAEVNYKVFADGFDYDSTLIEVKLPKNITDAVMVRFDYSLKVPRGDYLFGVSEHKNFAVLRGFYPALLFPHNRICNFTSNGIEDYPPADFKVLLEVSENINLLNPDFIKNARGGYLSEFRKSREVVLFLSQSDEPIYEDSVKVNNSYVKIFTLSGSKDLIPRIKKAVENSSDYLSRVFDKSPERDFMIVNLPRSLRLRNIYSAQVAAFHIDLFSPVWTKHPEAEVIKGMISRFTGNDFITDFADFPWLLNGIREYLTDEIFAEYYGKVSQSFKLVSYLPIKGETMFAYNEIPIIYRLNSFEYEPWQDKVRSYLTTKNKVGFVRPVNQILRKEDFDFVSEIKPALTLQVLKNYFGREKVNAVISRFRKLCLKNGFADEGNFNTAVKDVLGEKGIAIWKSLSNSSGNINYSIDALNKLYDNKYSLRLSKNGNIELPEKIVVYSKKDTLKLMWDGKERIKEIIFSSESDVFGAELDPENLNILDVNRADNSYLVNGNYSTAFAYAIHWFFWVQNALMLFGVFG